MFRPSDLQLVLLTGAVQRADGSLFPPPESIGGQASRIRRSIPPLIRNGLVSERPVSAPGLGWRQDGDTAYGAFITELGWEMIGAEPLQPPAPAVAAGQGDVASGNAPPAGTKPTKAALVLSLLRREQGATMDELVAATGWLPHTTRAALTGLRRKGHGIAWGKRGEATCYSLPQAA